MTAGGADGQARKSVAEADVDARGGSKTAGLVQAGVSSAIVNEHAPQPRPGRPGPMKSLVNLVAGALLPASSNTAPNDSNVMTDESSEEDILAEGISTLNMYPRNAPRAESADLERSNAPHRRHGERYFGYTVQETHSTLAESNRKLKAQLEEMTRDRDSLACEIYEREQQHQKAVQQHESTAALTQNLKKHNKILQTENEDQKNQIVRYKKVISSSTRHADQVADDSIRQQANQIFFAIQDFAARNFRGVKFDYTALPADTKAKIQHNIPAAQFLPPSLSVKIVISIVSRNAMDCFVPRHWYCGSQASVMQAASKIAQLEPESDPETKPLLNMLHKLIENHDGEMLGVGHDCLVQHLIRTTHRDIFAAMPVQFSKGIELALGKIFASSLEFALLLHRQAALFKMMWWPPVNTDGTNRPLNPKFEEDFNNGEEEDLKTRAMEMPLFPAVIKMGNEQGEKMVMHTVISKARVLVREATRVPADRT